MIHRQYGEIIFECDKCGETLETGEKVFGDAMLQFRTETWRSQKFDDKWTHFCSVCSTRPGFIRDEPLNLRDLLS